MHARSGVKVVSLVAVVGALTGCSPSAGKFSSAAEKYIQGDDVQVWAKQKHKFTNAACADPADTAVNTTFQCTADGADGHSYIFSVVITESRAFKIDSIQPKT